jgi:predicted alpha/beta-hydrolase family hydrolase
VQVGRRRLDRRAARARALATSAAAIDAALVTLVDRVTRRMRTARRVGRTVVLRLRFDDFSRATRSHTLPRATAGTGTILAAAAGSWPAPRRDQRQGITLVGVAVTSLDDECSIQLVLPFDRDVEARSTRPGRGAGALRVERDHARRAARPRPGTGDAAAAGLGPVKAVHHPLVTRSGWTRHTGLRRASPRSRGPRGALVLGHGAGGGVNARDLVAATGAALSLGFSVALVEQPYRVAGRRSPAPAHQLDAAWTAVVGQLAAGALGGLPVVAGGRSSGARVACRTAEATGAIGVLCLAFPLRPVRREGAPPAASRQPELDAVAVPVLVVQGASDPFGMPPPSALRTIVAVQGDHSLRRNAQEIASAVGTWLTALME